MNVFLATDKELFKSSDITQFDFCLWGWMKTGGYKRKVDTREKLLACILGAAAKRKET